MLRFALLLRPGIRPRSSGELMYMTMKAQEAKRVAQEMCTKRWPVGKLLWLCAARASSAGQRRGPTSNKKDHANS
jgi:hypothetical protein